MIPNAPRHTSVAAIAALPHGRPPLLSPRPPRTRYPMPTASQTATTRAGVQCLLRDARSHSYDPAMMKTAPARTSTGPVRPVSHPTSSAASTRAAAVSQLSLMLRRRACGVEPAGSRDRALASGCRWSESTPAMSFHW